MIRKILSTAVLFSLPVIATADYMVELDLNLSQGEVTYELDGFSGEEDTDTEGVNFSGQVYLGGVSTDGVPIREAGFLSKKSSVGALYGTSKEEFSSSDYEVDSMILFGQYVSSRTDFIIGGGLVEYEITRDYFGGELTADQHSYVITAGRYVGDKSAFMLSVAKTEMDEADYSDMSLSGSFKKVHDLGSENYFSWAARFSYIDGVRSFTFDDDGRTLSVGGELVWYIQRKLGLGMDLRLDLFSGLDRVDSAATALFSPKISYDFSEKFGLSANIRSEATVIEFDDDGDYEVSDVSYTVGATVRF
ncbi:MAG: hypothetical protein K6L81_16090 [Agarilytica sp.]